MSHQCTSIKGFEQGVKKNVNKFGKVWLGSLSQVNQQTISHWIEKPQLLL